MASIRKEIEVGVSRDEAWDALRDFTALHERLVPGFVIDVCMDGGDRIITFANGVKARERLVTADDERFRLAYTVVESPMDWVHHQATVEVREPATGQTGCRLVWITDALPDHLAPVLDEMMDQGVAAMTRALAG